MRPRHFLLSPDRTALSVSAGHAFSAVPGNPEEEPRDQLPRMLAGCMRGQSLSFPSRRMLRHPRGGLVIAIEGIKKKKRKLRGQSNLQLQAAKFRCDGRNGPSRGYAASSFGLSRGKEASLNGWYIALCTFSIFDSGCESLVAEIPGQPSFKLSMDPSCPGTQSRIFISHSTNTVPHTQEEVPDRRKPRGRGSA